MYGKYSEKIEKCLGFMLSIKRANARLQEEIKRGIYIYSLNCNNLSLNQLFRIKIVKNRAFLAKNGCFENKNDKFIKIASNLMKGAYLN